MSDWLACQTCTWTWVGEAPRDRREVILCDTCALTAPISHRDDMTPEDALEDCYDAWACGAWEQRNDTANLAEVMRHLARLFDKEEN